VQVRRPAQVTALLSAAAAPAHGVAGEHEEHDAGAFDDDADGGDYYDDFE
jgi:hypothetical protein